MKINLKSLLFNVLVPLMLSFIISMLVYDSYSFYDTIKTPIYLPPIVFSIVWTILYILMGISAYIIENKENVDSNERRKALRIYYIQLLVNLSYPVVFFYLQNLFLSMVLTIALLILLLITFYRFFKISKLSGVLLIPYIVWVMFANYLQISIYYLN